MQRKGHIPSRNNWAYWDWDFVAGTLIWSESVELLLGRSASELSGDPSLWRSLLHQQDQARVGRVIARTRASGERWSIAYRVKRKDGVFVRVLDRGTLIRDTSLALRECGSLVLVDDARVSSDRVLPEHWEESEEHFRAFVDWLPQLAWSATPDGWINWYNRRWYAYTETDLSQMEGWGWVRVHDPDDVLRVLRIIRTAFDSGEPWEDEFRLRRGSDGMLRWHLSRAMPLRDAHGRIVRWFGTNTDVHDQKLAAEAYSRMLAAEQYARREAEAANRAKDEFLAVVSHELRTPLNAILGWATLMTLGESFNDPDRRREAIARIDANARLQAKLIEDLLDLSRVMAGKFAVDLATIPVAPAVQAAIDASRVAAQKKQVTLRFEQRGPDVLVRGHTQRLQQIVSNLVDNAIKFSPPGGTITVTVERRDEGRVAIVVEDHGQGIENALLPHIFERFRQGDASSTRKHGGLGLGLAIVRQLVELHAGDVSVTSGGPGGGATFTVRLRVLSEEEAAAAPVAPGPSDTASIVLLTGTQVLVVDDELSSRDVVGEILLAAGATVTKVSSVHEALRTFRLSRPDVVVSDIAMPELDGYALIERIRSLADPDAATTPCMALTAYASIDDRDRAMTRGFNRYLPKPVDASRLTREIAELVRERLVS